jgi:hypothetical protein
VPLNGTLDVAVLGTDRVPTITDPAAADVTLPDAEILTLSFEHNHAVHTEYLPAALHPTVPPTLHWSFLVVDDGELGPFTLAQLRLGCRAGYRARSFLVASFVDNEVAGEPLRARWGFHAAPADVSVRRYYDRIEARVVAPDGTPILDGALVDPTPVAPSDATFTAALHLVRMPDAAVRIVQVDPEMQFRRADYGRPVLRAFDAGACGAPGLEARLPMAALAVRADIVLPAVRYSFAVDEPPQRSVQRIGAPGPSG